MSVLLGVVLLFALLSLVLAVVQAVAVARLAPAGERIASFFPLGWWKFRQLEAKAGPAAEGPLSVYKRAVIAFVVFVLLGLILSGWVVNQAPSNSSASLEPARINDWRVIPATFADLTDFRRVAPVPGAPVL